MRLKLWEVLGANASFVFRGLGTGVATKALVYASAAFLSRSVALGLMLPLILRDVVTALSSTPPDSRLLNQGMVSLAAVAVTVSATEWLLRPFWTYMARGIVSIKKRLVEREIAGRGEGGDVVGRIVSDVDFVIWNSSGGFTSMLPNFLMGAASLAAMLSLSPAIGLLGASIIPPFIILTEIYSRRVEHARNIERSYYSQNIHFAERYLSGEVGGLPQFRSALDRWLTGVVRLIHYDRIFWFSGLVVSTTLPLGVLWLGLAELGQGRIGVGAIAGSLYASVNYSMSLLNGFWGLCMLGQSLAPIKRVAMIAQERARTP
jgi:ABC-type multidrug transport system fused ATPase/permease subunit